MQVQKFAHQNTWNYNINNVIINWFFGRIVHMKKHIYQKYMRNKTGGLIKYESFKKCKRQSKRAYGRS